MKVVILAGGLGTRLSEATQLLPKPLVEIGDRPIIWHIMKIYAAAGFDEFIICCGYKGHMIKSYFCLLYTSRSSNSAMCCRCTCVSSTRPAASSPQAISRA